MAKDNAKTLDLKSLPRWQKYTIIAIISVLAAVFLISGPMIALVSDAQNAQAPQGTLNGEVLDAGEFLTYSTVLFDLSFRESASFLFPEVAIYNSAMEQLQPGNLPGAIDSRIAASDDAPSNRDDRLREFRGRLTWTYKILEEVADQEGIQVSPERTAAAARDALLGEVNMQDLLAQLPVESTDGEAEGAAEGAQDITDTEARRAQAMQLREQQYVTAIQQISPILSEADFEAMIARILKVKAYVERETARIGRVPLIDATDPFRAANQTASGRYVRVPVANPRTSASVAYTGSLPRYLADADRAAISLADGQLTYNSRIEAATADRLRRADSGNAAWTAAIDELQIQLGPVHPDVWKRALENLEKERAAARARRWVAQATAISQPTQFRDPVETYFNSQSRAQSGQTTGSNFHEAELIIDILSAEYLSPDSIASSGRVSIDDPLSAERVREYYQDPAFRNQYLRPDEAKADALAAEMQVDVEALVAASTADVFSMFRQIDSATPVVTVNPVTPGEGDDTEGEGDDTAEGEDAAEATEPVSHPLVSRIMDPLTETLAFPPLSEARSMIRAILADEARRETARRTMRAIAGTQPESRIAEVRNSLQRARADLSSMARTKSEQASALDTLYWGGTNRTGEYNTIGLVPAVEELTNRLDAALDRFANEIGLDADPSSPVDLDQYNRELMSSVALRVAIQFRNDLLDRVRLDPAKSAIWDEIDVPALEVAIANARLQRDDSRSRNNTANVERLTTMIEGMEQRLAIATAARDAFLGAFDKMERRIDEEARYSLALQGRLGGNMIVALVEPRVIALRRDLKAIVDDAMAPLNLETAAYEARNQALRAQQELRRFEPVVGPQQTGPTGDNLDIVESLPPTRFGLPVYTVANEVRFPGKFYRGLPGANIPSFEYRWGKTIQEIIHDEDLRAALPWFAEAEGWNLENDSASNQSLVSILQTLAEGQYSPVLGVDGVGYYLIAVRQRRDPVSRSLAEQEDAVIRQMLLRNGSRLTTAATELTTELRDKLRAHIDRLVGATPSELSTWLDAARGDLVGANIPTPYGSSDAETPYSANAMASVSSFLRGGNSESAETSISSQRDAATEARALLLHDAVMQTVARYHLPTGVIRDIAATDVLNELELNDVVARPFWREAIAGVPYLSVRGPVNENFPSADPQMPSQLRQARLLVLPFGPSGEGEPIDLSTVDDISSVESHRDTIERIKLAQSPFIRRITDFGRLVRWCNAEGNLPVVIDEIPPRDGR